MSNSIETIIKEYPLADACAIKFVREIDAIMKEFLLTNHISPNKHIANANFEELADIFAEGIERLSNSHFMREYKSLQLIQQAWRGGKPYTHAMYYFIPYH